VVFTAAGKTAQVPLQIVFNVDMFVTNTLDKAARHLEFNKFAKPLLYGTMIAAVPFSATAAAADFLSGFIRQPINTSKMG